LDAPIVVTELYEVAPGHEADFYSWGTALIEVIAQGGSGYLGGDVRDPEWKDGEWQIVHRWADRELAREWNESATRARWLTAAASFARARPARERPPRAPATATPAEPAPAAASPGGPPPKWKMAVVTLAAVFPPVLFFNVTLIPRLRDVSVVLRTLVLCIGVTAVVTWIMMPRLMRLFKGWLNPAPAPGRAGAPAAPLADPVSPGEAGAAADPYPRFRPAAEPISGRGTRSPARSTRSPARTTRSPARGARTSTLDPTDTYPRRNR